MDGDTINGGLHPLQWSVVLRIDWYPFKLIQSVPPVYHLPKHRVPWRERSVKIRWSWCLSDRMLTWGPGRAGGHMWETTGCRWSSVQSWPLRAHPLFCASSHPWSHPDIDFVFRRKLWIVNCSSGDVLNLKLPAPNALTTLPSVCWVSCLDHESLKRWY